MLNDKDGTLSQVETIANDPQYASVKSSDTDVVTDTNQDDKQEVTAQDADQKADSDDREVLENASDSSTEAETEGEQKTTPTDEQVQKSEPDKTQQSTSQQSKQKDDDSRLDKHPRFQELIQERNANKPLVEFAKYDQDFCQKWKISPQQRQEAMNLVALLNSNPEAFLTQMQQNVAKYEVMLGKRLPEDLDKAVANGELTEQRAKELATLRMQTETSRQQATQHEQQLQQQRSQQFQSTLSQWDFMQRRSDPDFHPKEADAPDGKYEFVAEKIKVLALENPPQTVEDVARLANQAYADVTAMFRRFMPAPKTRKSLKSEGSENTSNLGEPGSMQEAMARAAAKHGLRLTPQT